MGSEMCIRDRARDALSIVTIRDSLLISEEGSIRDIEQPIAHRVAKTMEPTTISAMAVWNVAAPTIISCPLHNLDLLPTPEYPDSTAIQGSPQT